MNTHKCFIESNRKIKDSSASFDKQKLGVKN